MENKQEEVERDYIEFRKEISDNAIEIREFNKHSVLFYLVFVTESYAIALNNAEKILYIAST